MVNNIPTNIDGSESNTESTREFESVESAKIFYSVVKQRMQSVNNWHSFAGALTADFQLTDKEGNEINRQPQKGDFFRIRIPGPGTVTGEGYDWVQVEKIDEENNREDQFIIRVRPAPSPVNTKEDVAHFFTDEATSSFVVKRVRNKVIAGVYGRNEKPNTEAENVLDKIRNAVVASGAITAFSKLQWKSLVDGLISEEN